LHKSLPYSDSFLSSAFWLTIILQIQFSPSILRLMHRCVSVLPTYCLQRCVSVLPTYCLVFNAHKHFVRPSKLSRKVTFAFYTQEVPFSSIGHYTGYI